MPFDPANKPPSMKETQDAALDCCLAWCPEVMAAQERLNNKAGGKASARAAAAAEEAARPCLASGAGVKGTASEAGADEAMDATGVDDAAEIVGKLAVAKESS